MLLAIDTSTRYAGVALWDGERVSASASWYSRRNHTAELMPAIEQIMGRAGVGTEVLGGIAVALGPGGFSALRVGLSTAKGMATALELPIAGIGTLEMEAHPYLGLGLPVCPLLEMGRGEVATAIYRDSAVGKKLINEERVCKPEELVESTSERTLFSGEGTPQHAEYLRLALGENAVVVGPYAPVVRLWALAQLGAGRLASGDTDNLATLQPRYLRRPSIGTPNPPRRVAP